MAQKNAIPTREHAASLRKAGLRPEYWVVVKELRVTLIVRNRQTCEIRLIDK